MTNCPNLESRQRFAHLALERKIFSASRPRLSPTRDLQHLRQPPPCHIHPHSVLSILCATLSNTSLSSTITRLSPSVPESLEDPEEAENGSSTCEDQKGSSRCSSGDRSRSLDLPGKGASSAGLRKANSLQKQHAVSYKHCLMSKWRWTKGKLTH